jgi:hypothetical protein
MGCHNSLSNADEGFKLASRVRFICGLETLHAQGRDCRDVHKRVHIGGWREYKIAIQSIVNPANLNKFGGYWFSLRDGDRPVRPAHFIIMETDINKLYGWQTSKFKSQVSMCLVPYGSSKMPV